MAYATGQYVAQDYAEAARRFRAAAEQGYADAQVSLGLLYADGQGVAQDFTAAYAWVATATAQGLDSAVEILQALRREMTPPEFDRAIELSREYREEYVTD